MIQYEEPIFRPPSEARSLILQATLGCSHNRCAFCVSFRSKKFRVKPREALLAEIDWAARELPHVRKVFLADGDAMVLSTSRLMEILSHLYRNFRLLEKVTIYARAQNFKNKTVDQLKELKAAGLSMIYLGAESGDDEVLRRIDKGVTAKEMIDLCQKPKEADIDLSITVILGLAGPKGSDSHARKTGELLTAIAPRYASALTLMLAPRRPSFEEAYGDKDWRVMDQLEILAECATLIDTIDADNVTFRSNHASNYLSLGGDLQKDKKRLLASIAEVLKNPRPDRLRPEFMRRL